MTDYESEAEARPTIVILRTLPLVKLLELCDLEDDLTRELVRRIRELRRQLVHANRDCALHIDTIQQDQQKLRDLRKKIDDLETEAGMHGFDDGTPDGFRRSI